MATETLRIFVGTDQWQRDAGAERVLEHSIRKNATCGVDITWMRADSPGYETSEHGGNNTWRTNAPPGSAWKKVGGWGTPFACFRFAVPEMCGFEGRAVYLDADMLVRGDVRELLETPLQRGYRTIDPKRTDVSVIDCAFFMDKKWWPRISAMKSSGWVTYHYCQLLHGNQGIAPTLDPAWNVCDSLYSNPDPGVAKAKLLHFTTVPTQPYRPYPSVKYHPHPWPSWVKAWQDELAEANVAT